LDGGATDQVAPLITSGSGDRGSPGLGGSTAAKSAGGSTLAAAAPPQITQLGAWVTSGFRVVFAARVDKREGLWVAENNGTSSPRRIASANYVKPGIPTDIAIGPNGTVGCASVPSSESEGAPSPVTSP